MIDLSDYWAFRHTSVVDGGWWMVGGGWWGDASGGTQEDPHFPDKEVRHLSWASRYIAPWRGGDASGGTLKKTQTPFFQGISVVEWEGSNASNVVIDRLIDCWLSITSVVGMHQKVHKKTPSPPLLVSGIRKR